MLSRTVKQGTPLATLGELRVELAESAMDVTQMRLLVLMAAHRIDTVGAKDAREEISMAKVRVLEQALRVIDKAMCVFGGVGLSHQFPLASWHARTDSARRMDGTSHVHRAVIAKTQLAKL